MRLIFAFEAVIIGGLGSLWGTLVGGIILGVAQTVGSQINPAYEILAGHLVFLACAGVPAPGPVRPRQGAPGMSAAVDAAGAFASRAAPRQTRVTALLAALVLFVGPGAPCRPGATRGTMKLLVEFFTLLAMAQMWNLLAGYAGLVSIGQQAFIGLGAYGLFLDDIARHRRSSRPSSAPRPCDRGRRAADGALRVPPAGRLLRRSAHGSSPRSSASSSSSTKQLGAGTGVDDPGAGRDDRRRPRGADLLAGPRCRASARSSWSALIMRSRLGLALRRSATTRSPRASLGVDVFRVKLLIYVVAAVGVRHRRSGHLHAAAAHPAERRLRGGLDGADDLHRGHRRASAGSRARSSGAIVFFVLQETLADYGSLYLIILGSVAIAIARPRAAGHLGPRLTSDPADQPVRHRSGDSSWRADRGRRPGRTSHDTE